MMPLLLLLLMMMLTIFFCPSFQANFCFYKLNKPLTHSHTHADTNCSVRWNVSRQFCSPLLFADVLKMGRWSAAAGGQEKEHPKSEQQEDIWSGEDTIFFLIVFYFFFFFDLCVCFMFQVSLWRSEMSSSSSLTWSFCTGYILICCCCSVLRRSQLWQQTICSSADA